jgi:hypothetical protein
MVETEFIRHLRESRSGVVAMPVQSTGHSQSSAFLESLSSVTSALKNIAGTI